MKIRGDIARRRRDILAAAAEHGAREVRIFGSVARGDRIGGTGTPTSVINGFRLRAFPDSARIDSVVRSFLAVDK